MSEQKPANPGRRRFFGELLSNMGREAGLLARDAGLAAREIGRVLADAGEEIHAVAVETPIHADLDEAELTERLDAIDGELAELEGQVQRLVEAAAQPQPLAAEDRELLRRVAELLAAHHTELQENAPVTAETDDESDDEASVLRRRRQALRDWTWKLITALFGIRLFDALYETFVSNELVPWAAEQWRGIFAQAEAAGVIERSPLSSPLTSPTAESPSPVETPTPKPETPTPPRRTSRPGRILVPEMVTVPAGHFWMGSDKRIDKDADDDELPQHRLYLPGYRIGKYPVTNEEYAAFLAATGHRKPYRWEENQSRLDHPVVDVSWDAATAYCRWLSETTGQRYRLPSEAEWEKAARGTDGRIYPWGNQPPDERRCNFNNNVKDTTPVGSYPAGVSPYGCYDMAGNVWEWTSSLSWDYPYRADDGREVQVEDGNGLSVYRGGAYWVDRKLVRCAYRGWYLAGDGNDDNGYRLATGLSR